MEKNKNNRICGIIIAVSIMGCSHLLTAQNLDDMLDPRDVKSYKTVEIGQQVWMAENLNFASSEIRVYCYDDDTLNCNKFGALYSWETAMKACPAGWHLPSKEEFKILLNSIGSNSKEIYARMVLHGSSDSHFNVLLSGYLFGASYYPQFLGINKIATFWTNTEFRKSYAYRLILFKGGLRDVALGDASKKSANSVRCIKD